MEVTKTMTPKKLKVNLIFKLKVFPFTETTKRITLAQSRTDKSPKGVEDLTQVEIIAHHCLDI